MNVISGIVLALIGVCILIVPHCLFVHDMSPEGVTAWGQWVGNAIIAVASALAIQQLVLSKKASESDLFLKICDMVDDKEFLANYALILKHHDQLTDACVCERGLEALSANPEYAAIENAARDTLYQLEKVGILMHHAVVNKRMVTDYIGEVVMRSVRVLGGLIEFERKADQGMWERLVELRDTCVGNGWTTAVSETLDPSGVARH